MSIPKEPNNGQTPLYPLELEPGGEQPTLPPVAGDGMLVDISEEKVDISDCYCATCKECLAIDDDKCPRCNTIRPRCTKCNEPLAAHIRFCPQCGTKCTDALRTLTIPYSRAMTPRGLSMPPLPKIQSENLTPIQTPPMPLKIPSPPPKRSSANAMPVNPTPDRPKIRGKLPSIPREEPISELPVSDRNTPLIPIGEPKPDGTHATVDQEWLRKRKPPPSKP
ncbi:MAG: zinc ribbon domain-containing protein [Patescibacteria group bacterium]|jgi:hypothetical protein